MKKIILEWSRPHFTYSTHIAYPLAILGEDPYAQDWIYSHYINLHVNDISGMYSNAKDYFTTNIFSMATGDAWGGVPPLTYEITRKHLLNISSEGLFDYIYESLLRGKFIFTHINFKGLLRDADYIHNILIHGIDFEERKVHLLGFKEQLFCSHSEDFKCFSESFYSPFSDNVTRKIILLSKNNRTYTFNPAVLVTQVNDYLESRLSLDRLEYYFCNDMPITHLNEEDYYEFIQNDLAKSKKTYGVGAQDILTGYLDYYINNKDTEPFFDLRNYRCFMEHRQMMYKRWNHWAKKGCLAIDKNLLNNFNLYTQKASVIFYSLVKMYLLSAFSSEKLISHRNTIKEMLIDECRDMQKIADSL
jgi:hypothetical protein